MPPSVFFRNDDEGLAVANQVQPGVLSLAADGPRLVGFVIDLLQVTGVDIGK